MPVALVPNPQPQVCAEFEKTLQKCIFEHDDETCHTIFKNIHLGFYNACIKKKEISSK
jgi:hypothetical protein